MQKSRKRTIYAAIALFVVAVILYLIIKVIPSVTGALTGTEVVEYGELMVSDKTTCYIVRDEKVYTAGESETLKFFIKEGTQIKKGTKVLDAKADANVSSSEKYAALTKKLKGNSIPDNQKHVSQQKGIFSFYVDGYEAYFTPDRMIDLDKEKVGELDVEPVNVIREKAAKGEPIYKISNNSIWYIVFWIDKADIRKYEAGKNITAKLGDEEIECRIDNIKEAKDGWMIILSTNRYYSGFNSSRKVEGEIISTDLKGIIVSNSCIITKDDQVGVYVKDTTDEFSFVPVQILGTDGEKSVVTEGLYYDKKGKRVNTVNNYDEIKTHPKED